MIEIRPEFRRQLERPEHCLLMLIPEIKRSREVVPPRFFSHSSRVKDDQGGPTLECKGQPIRFTRLAGESMLRWAVKNGFALAKLVEVP